MPVKAFSSYPPFERDSALRRALVAKDRIADLCRILELYEGLCVIRTAEPDKGLVEFWISPSFLEDFDRIMAALAKDVPVEFLDEKGDE